MVFDHAQSPRLGQPTPVESTVVRIFTGVEIPEAAWTGQMIFRSDTQNLQVFTGTAWEDVVGGIPGLLTFVGPTAPLAVNLGDLWYDSSDGHSLHRWDGEFWQLIPFGSSAIADGAITGAKVASDAIDGKMITGATIRTSNNPARVEQNDQGLIVYKDDQPTTTLGSDGNVTVKGQGEFESLIAENLMIAGENNFIAQGGKLILQTSVGNPTAVPTAYMAYSQVFVDNWPEEYQDYQARGIAYKSSTGNWLISLTAPLGVDEDRAVVLEYDTDGTFVGVECAVTTPAYPSHYDTRNIVACGSDWVSVMHNGGIRYLALNDGPSGEDDLYTLPPVGNDVPALSWDGTYLYVTFPASFGSSQLRRLRFDISGGALDSPTDEDLFSIDDGDCLAYLPGGSFDFGVTRDVVMRKDINETATVNVLNPATGWLTVANESWPLYQQTDAVGIAWDGSNFWQLNGGPDRAGCFLIKYQGGGNKWTTESSTWWVQYAWYDSVGTVHTTTVSPARSVTMTKRAVLNMYAPDIPSGGVDDPDGIAVYLGRGTSQPAASAMWLQGTTSGGVRSLSIFSAVFSGTSASGVVNNFPTGTPAEITSTNAETVIKGDGETTVKVLHAYSGTDVNTTSGNKPALRTGNIAGQHLRIDGNEIQAMVSDTTDDVGTLILNQGGGAVKIGALARSISSVDFGRETTETTNGSSQVTISHDMDLTPDIVLITGGGSSGRNFEVSAKDSNSVTITVRDADGTLSGSGVTPNFFWLVIA